MFLDELEKIFWEEMIKVIYFKIDVDVCCVLLKEYCDVNDFMVLILLVVVLYLEMMVCFSWKYMMECFGKIILMFVFFYIINFCINLCVYCGFNYNNLMKCIIFMEEEMVNEYKVIKKLVFFENLLLVIGENFVKVGVDYIECVFLLVKFYFVNFQIEVMLFKVEEYE